MSPLSSNRRPTPANVRSPLRTALGVGSVGQRPAGRAERVVGVVPPDQAQVGDLGRRARRSRERRSGRCRPRRPRSGRRARRPVRSPSDSVAPSSARRRSAAAASPTITSKASEPPGPVGEPRQELGHATVAGIRDEGRRTDSPVAGRRAVEPADPALERGDDVGPRREHVGVVPVGVEQHPDRPAGTDRSCRRTRRPRRRSALPVPSRTTDASAPVSSGGRTAPTKADGSSPARTEQVDQPAGRRRLAVGAGHRQEVAATGRDRVGDELLAADRRDRRPGAPRGARAGRDRPRSAPSTRRSGRRRPPRRHRRRGRRSCCQAIGMPARLDRVAVAGRLARVAAADPGPGGVGQQERGRGRRTGRADHVDPLARRRSNAAPGPARDRGRSRRRCGSPPGGRVGHRAPAGRRERSRRFGGGDEQLERGDGARALVGGPVAGPDEPSDVDPGGPWRGRGRSGRRASPGCRRPARRCRSPRRRRSRPAARAHPRPSPGRPGR